ncbi:MAG: hypothetical protein D6814_01030 [Calditrichaeota bacterium]|nr:MAG: hypothetical protein D6814_01030 [Calditrichota bacterium]
MEYTAERLKRYKWTVLASQRIEAPPQKIWSAIATPGNLENCHPFCEENLVYKWPGIGSRDAIHYYSGWILQREFVNWIDGVGYDLTIGKEDGRKSYVTWRITEERGKTGRLTITIYPYIFQKVPVAIRWILYTVKVQPELSRYLESVVKGFDWYITTGQPVKKSQFGSHNWFSNNDT